jgi:NTP pyrophosphatase (non-canonical NTP hydrolase)
MDKENNIEAIGKEFQAVREELKDILLDIRVFLMEAQSPIPNDLEKEQLKEELKTKRG